MNSEAGGLKSEFDNPAKTLFWEKYWLKDFLVTFSTIFPKR